MYTDIIYDFDGTLSDTYPVFTEAFIKLLNNHGLDDTYENVYANLKVSVRYAVKCYEWDVPINDIRAEFKSIHVALAFEKQRMIEGADVVLRAAVEQGKRNYLYTHSGAYVNKLLEKMGIAQYFTEVMDGSLDFPMKPAPDALNWLMDRRGIDRSRALMVGDREMDIGAAHNSGIHGCLMDVDGFYPDTVAEHHIEKLTELLDII